MAITEAVENYLETILILSKAQPDVHAIDICSYLGYSRPTVSITLTDAGLSVAERIYDRHNILSEFFMMLGVKKDQALEDACKVEHDLSDETYSLLKAYYLKLANGKAD